MVILLLHFGHLGVGPTFRSKKNRRSVLKGNNWMRRYNLIVIDLSVHLGHQGNYREIATHRGEGGIISLHFWRFLHKRHFVSVSMISLALGSMTNMNCLNVQSRTTCDWTLAGRFWGILRCKVDELIYAPVRLSFHDLRTECANLLHQKSQWSFDKRLGLLYSSKGKSLASLERNQNYFIASVNHNLTWINLIIFKLTQPPS